MSGQYAAQSLHARQLPPAFSGREVFRADTIDISTSHRRGDLIAGEPVTVILHDGPKNVLAQKWFDRNQFSESTQLVLLINEKPIPVRYQVSTEMFPGGVNLLLSRRYLVSMSRTSQFGSKPQRRQQVPLPTQRSQSQSVRMALPPHVEETPLRHVASDCQLADAHVVAKFEATVNPECLSLPPNCTQKQWERPAMTPQQVSSALGVLAQQETDDVEMRAPAAPSLTESDQRSEKHGIALREERFADSHQYAFTLDFCFAISGDYAFNIKDYLTA